MTVPAILSALSLAFAAPPLPPPEPLEPDQLPVQEQVFGFREEAGKVFLRVPSNGCTAAEDFDIKVEHKDGGAQLSVVRTRPDLCRGLFPSGTWVSWARKKLGIRHGESILVFNPDGAVAPVELRK